MNVLAGQEINKEYEDNLKGKERHHQVPCRNPKEEKYNI